MMNWPKLLAVMGLLWVTPAFAQSTEQRMQFLEGLRDRGYHDSAIFYLDLQRAQKNTPADFLQLIPYEKAVTLMQSVRTLRNPVQQNEQLEQALKFLDEFVKASPNHAKAGDANSERARIKLGQARVAIWQSRSPSNQDTKGEFQNQARKLIAAARKIFQTAHDQHKKNWESFPKYIDQREDSDRYAARAAAESSYMQAQYDLALCTYEEAQTYDKTAADYKRILIQASTEFSAIHEKHRSQRVGLYSRMWQGKCFEEQDDIARALGIYNELLGHPGKSDTMKRIQAQVLQFRLICLNHEQRKDHQLVVQEGEDWLTKNRARGARTEVGLGIRWQVALAQETLADERTLGEPDRERLVRQSLVNVRTVEKYPGEYKDKAIFMIRRLTVKLRGKDAGDPEDFDSAFGIARNMMTQLQKLQDKLTTTKDAKERAKIEEDRRLLCEETARLLRLAVTLADAGTDRNDVNQLRYLLAYVCLQTHRNYEAAFLGEYVAREYKKEDEYTGLSLDGAYLAMAAYIRAYNDSPKSEKEVDMRLILRMCDLITTEWKDSDRANDARMQMGDVFRQMDKPMEAAEWYGNIPKQAPQYAQAQTNSGQAYMNAYLNAATLPAEERPSVEELNKWQAAAEKHLRAGIEKTQQEIPAAGASPETLIAAKASLVQMVLSQGKYKEAIALLQNDPHAVIKAVAIDDSSKRPKKGVQSPEFAGLAYQLLLRAHIGLRQLREARATMRELEKVAGAGDAVTSIYVQLGRELETELKTLKSLGDDARFTQVRSSFENFLSDMFDRDDQTYSSLIWIAETYYGLGMGSEDVPADAATYFERAGTTFQEIVNKAKEDSSFADEKRLTGVKLRLVTCKRREGEFSAALDLVADILAAVPKALDAQFEAASVYQAWGESGQGDSVEYFRKAIEGDEYGAKKAAIWGWGQIGLLLQRNLSLGPQGSNAAFAEKFLQARYNVAHCRLRSAGAEQDMEKTKKQLGRAKQGIQMLAATTPDMSDEWWKKFNTLYDQIGKELTSLGETVEPLDRRQAAAPTMAVAASEKASPKKKESKAKKSAASAQPDGGGGSLSTILGLLVAVAAAAAVVYFMMAGAKKGKRRVTYGSAAPVPVPAEKRPKRTQPQAAGAKQARPTQGKPKAAGSKPTRPSQPKKQRPQ